MCNSITIAIIIGAVTVAPPLTGHGSAQRGRTSPPPLYVLGVVEVVTLHWTVKWICEFPTGMGRCNSDNAAYMYCN